MTEIRDASRTFIADREVGCSVYLVGLADQCEVDLGSAALAKIKATADKHPTDQNRGVAPDKTQRGAG